MMIVTKYYYTYDEIISEYGSEPATLQLFLFNICGITYTPTANQETVFALAKKIFKNWNWCVLDKEYQTPTALSELGRQLVLWCEVESDFYDLLYTKYNSLLTDIIAPIANTQSTNYNSYVDETPQVKITDTSVFSKEHANQYNYGDSSVTNANDNLYNIEKLDMLKRLFFDVKSEWANSLSKYLVGESYE